MRSIPAGKIGVLLLILVALVLVSGCETAGAMRTGELRMNDLVQIAKLGSSSPKPYHQKVGQQESVLDFQGIDSWIQTNLW
jgi:hypothetical protein